MNNSAANPVDLRQGASLARLQSRTLGNGYRRSRFHRSQRDAIRRRRSRFSPALDAHDGTLGEAPALFRPRNGERACWTSKPRHRPRYSPTRPAGSTATTRSSSVCRRTVRSVARSFPPAACAWWKQASRLPGFEADPAVHQAFTQYRKTHNDGVFDAYTPEILAAAARASSPDCRMRMVAAGSSAITAAWRSMALTG